MGTTKDTNKDVIAAFVGLAAYCFIANSFYSTYDGIKNAKNSINRDNQVRAKYWEDTAAVKKKLLAEENKPTKPEEEVKTFGMKLADADTVSIASSLCKSHTEYRFDKCMRIWFNIHKNFSLLDIKKNETSVAKILKVHDTDSELGKRVCITGILMSIKEDSNGAAKGTFITTDDGSSTVEITSLGSTEGVENGKNHLRFCGFITGMSGEGMFARTEMLGMFDIPENKKL